MSGTKTANRTQDRGHAQERGWLGVTLQKFPWVHLSLGLLGNLMFFVGSIMFFYESLKHLGIWLFVVGSFLMLVGSVGEFLIRIEKKRHSDG